MTFHIVRRSDGSGGLDSGDLSDILAQLNADFRDARIVFYCAGPTDYINDTGYFQEVTTDAELDALLAVENVNRVVDIYFVKEFSRDGDALCGIGTFSSMRRPHGIVMANSCTINRGNPSTMTHEMGHYLDLYHTHETAFGAECVDGSNCSWAGDKVCDTPADPELGSHNVSRCEYDGGVSDSCSSRTYDPLVDNFMSYAPDACRTSFTPGQIARLDQTIRGSRADHVTVEWPSSSATYVDRRFVGYEIGSSQAPFDTVADGIAHARLVGHDLLIVAGGRYRETLTTLTPVRDLRIVPTAGTELIVGP